MALPDPEQVRALLRVLIEEGCASFKSGGLEIIPAPGALKAHAERVQHERALKEYHERLAKEQAEAEAKKPAAPPEFLDTRDVPRPEPADGFMIDGQPVDEEVLYRSSDPGAGGDEPLEGPPE